MGLAGFGKVHGIINITVWSCEVRYGVVMFGNVRLGTVGIIK